MERALSTLGEMKKSYRASMRKDPATQPDEGLDLDMPDSMNVQEE